MSSDPVLLLVCYLGSIFLNKNPRNICVAIILGLTKKSLVCLDYNMKSTFQHV